MKTRVSIKYFVNGCSIKKNLVQEEYWELGYNSMRF